MPKTYNDLYLATRTALKNAGVEAYALEARLLVAYAVGKTKEEFVRDLRLYTSDENEQKIAALLQRRIAGEPLAYLIGEWEFHGLPIVVTPDVLIPRMDTEVLVDAALRVLVGRKMNARILDLCSGSGCIGCALAHELPAARVVMMDISDEALTVSKENLRRNHQNRTICLKADALAKPPMGIGTFDLIVSNPPYVASMDILTLDSSVRDYEPLGALDGGEDGLMFYRAIVRHWTQILRPGGWLMFEVGEDQADAVMALMTEEKIHRCDRPRGHRRHPARRRRPHLILRGESLWLKRKNPHPFPPAPSNRRIRRKRSRPRSPRSRRTSARAPSCASATTFP